MQMFHQASFLFGIFAYFFLLSKLWDDGLKTFKELCGSQAGLMVALSP